MKQTYCCGVVMHVRLTSAPEAMQSQKLGAPAALITDEEDDGVNEVEDGRGSRGGSR